MLKLEPTPAPLPAGLGDPLSPYLTSDEAARFLRFSSAAHFRRWAARRGIRPNKRGRFLLWDRRYLQAVIAPQPVVVRTKQGRRW